MNAEEKLTSTTRESVQLRASPTQNTKIKQTQELSGSFNRHSNGNSLNFRSYFRNPGAPYLTDI